MTWPLVVLGVTLVLGLGGMKLWQYILEKNARRRDASSSSLAWKWTRSRRGSSRPSATLELRSSSLATTSPTSSREALKGN